MMLLQYRTAVQERQFEAICRRILNAKKHLANMKQCMIHQKREKPRAVSHSDF